MKNFTNNTFYALNDPTITPVQKITEAILTLELAFRLQIGFDKQLIDEACFTMPCIIKTDVLNIGIKRDLLNSLILKKDFIILFY